MLDKEELLVLLAGAVSAEVPMVEDRPPWQERLVEMARRYRQVLFAHRDGPRLLASVAPAGPRRLRHVEAILRLLLSAGFAPQDAVRAAYHFNNLVTEFVADEARMATAVEAAGTSRSEFIAEARKQLRALPADEYPVLRQLADLVVNDDAEGLFQFGLELCLSGLEWLRQSTQKPGRQQPAVRHREIATLARSGHKRSTAPASKSRSRRFHLLRAHLG